ncbi:delta-60 repeat domain-containing protein [Actinomadura sp. NAK00032]|uniref:delta-60 repeat domain-containing protein n=1 Tax=Actinomadura sp. NAK00032 TaxID=2742128 RepID=UPI001591BAE9|nr:delta-60 repeat domain-containing protein [Actinomadura sp. NAK00032]QKW36283.1 delta-60 repeat domain-containing protein [Actinomadura sp. NAK00032]
MPSLKRKITVTAVTALAVFVQGAVATSTARADIQHGHVVGENPVDNTPHVLDGTVRGVAVIGDKVIVGGNFSKIQNAATGSPIIEQSHLFAYDKTTGLIEEDFRPQIVFKPETSPVIYAVAPGPDNTVFIGGKFETINGTTAKRLARLNVSTGVVDSRFNRSTIDFGAITSLVSRGGFLYVSGEFGTITDTVTNERRSNLARLDPNTGALDPAFNIIVSEKRDQAAKLNVRNMAVDQAHTKLLINGTFTQVNGESRPQIAMIDLASTPTLSSWATDDYSGKCHPDYYTYMRDMDFSPDGSYFVVVTTGGPGYGITRLCDSAARWETNRTGPRQSPTWVNYTGGDTLLAVAVTGAAVYVGGHQRWLDNPQGYNSPGPGAVERPGIGAIHPETGLAKDISWNPTRSLGVGVEAFVAVPEGLIVGSDTDELGHEYHGRIGMFPLP